MALTVVKTFIAGEVLFASDLNAEFANIINEGEDLVTPATKAHDMNGFEFVLNAPGDTSITADTDDRIDLKLGGTDLFRFDGTTASSVNGLDFVAAATGADVVILATGDANTDIDIQASGTGVVLANGDGPLGILASQSFSY